ncbi:MAG: histidinol dehydrogenase, partial [Gemmatimonadales bacterium]
FVKRTSIIRYAPERLARDADAIIALAEAEGLFGHAEAVRVRVGTKRDVTDSGAAGPRGSRDGQRGSGAAGQ